MKKWFAYIAVLLIARFGAAQGVVEGVVRDAAGAPLEYATVGIPGSGIGTTTDARGRYRLTVSAADTVVIRYSFTGFTPAERRLWVRGNMRVDIALRPLAKQLEAVEVSDEGTRQSAFTQVDIERLEDAVGPAAGVEGVIKLLPDVNSNNELSSQYSVRGGSFDENLVYINGVEVYRPMLVRSAQQEGMSIINPDLVSFILFSPGGFDVGYGDRLSSVLDITYGRPSERRFRVSGSLLGGSLAGQGTLGQRLAYAVGARYHSNAYVLGSLDTKGAYTTRYADLQAVLSYRASERLDIGLLLIGTRNRYALVPESQTTTFGNFFSPMELRIYFDGQEEDRYLTTLAALRADYHPSDDWRLRATLSAQAMDEREHYDIQDQYFLYEVHQTGAAGDTAQFDRGVGTFLEHARNRLRTSILNLDLRATRHAVLGSWQMGLSMQRESFSDHLREWRWVDSAGYALPYFPQPPGDSTNPPQVPQLQSFVAADNSLRTLRAAAFVQREVGFTTRSGGEWHAVAGMRFQLYGGSHAKPTPMLSPRISASYKPNIKQDVMLRLAAGIYRQAPFYREYRYADGHLATGLEPQSSYQVAATADWRLRLWQHPFTLTADLYYKYLTHIVPYTVDNLRLRYHPDQQAVGYAAGIGLRLGGELVQGLESWLSLSLMKTQEDIAGDGLGYLSRPTDQRLSIKVFLQDNVPTIPWWRMSLGLVYGSGMPVFYPSGLRSEHESRIPAYYRVDWGNTVRLTDFPFFAQTKPFSRFEEILLTLEVFNLLGFRNVSSFLWVADYENHYYRVPNYLTARQLNLNITLLF